MRPGCWRRSTKRPSCARAWPMIWLTGWCGSCPASDRVAGLCRVLYLNRVDRVAVAQHLSRYGLALTLIAPEEVIPGSYWGDSEAGLKGDRVYARLDTPVHSVLHEACHYICMAPERRAGLDRDAGGDDLEESAVCYLQVLLADELPGVGWGRL